MNRIKAVLGFLVDEYNMCYVFRELPDVKGIYNPTYLYSFYNQHGCITIKEIVQRGEIACYIATHYDEDPYKCIQTRVNEKNYLKRRSIYFTRTYLKYLARFIRNSIVETGEVWGITIKKEL